MNYHAARTYCDTLRAGLPLASANHPSGILYSEVSTLIYRRTSIATSRPDASRTGHNSTKPFPPHHQDEPERPSPQQVGAKPPGDRPVRPLQPQKYPAAGLPDVQRKRLQGLHGTGQAGGRRQAHDPEGLGGQLRLGAGQAVRHPAESPGQYGGPVPDRRTSGCLPISPW